VREGGRLSAAIEVFTEVAERGRPVRLALKAWGERSRFAGSADRAFVSGLVLDALRRRRSLAWMMGEETPRAAVFATLAHLWGWAPSRVAAGAAEAPHGPGALSAAEQGGLAAPRSLEDAPPAVRGDYADWMDAYLERVFGTRRAEALRALAERAPTDLRVNTLKSDPARTLKALGHFEARPAGVLPTALRVAPLVASARSAAVETAPEFEKGWFEIQDLGSQIAAACAGDIAHRQVLDYCAGGGGKTLALAAAMANTGQIFAHDSEARRLTDTVRRSRRAGVRNLQVRSPLQPDALAGLEGRMDLVFADAPCTGSGAWRRHPDTKWRLTPEQMTRRMADQDAVLAGGALYVKPGGRLIYVTCSLFAEENEDRVAAFLAGRPDFAVEPPAAPGDLPLTHEGFLRLTPLTAGTDGFFVANLRRKT
jgi:16S rRNA (cytosine967-C5)-methyltransferase